MQNSEDPPLLAEVFGGPFRVYSTREFPGLEPSTDLTRVSSVSSFRISQYSDHLLRASPSTVFASPSAMLSGSQRSEYDEGQLLPCPRFIRSSALRPSPSQSRCIACTFHPHITRYPCHTHCIFAHFVPALPSRYLSLLRFPRFTLYNQKFHKHLIAASHIFPVLGCLKLSARRALSGHVM